MALIDSSTYAILNSRTIMSILTSSKVQNNKNYPHLRSSYFDIKKVSESKILLLVKSTYISNIEKIHDDIARLFSTDVLIKKKKILVESETSNAVGFNFILDLQQQSKSVKILFKSAKSEIKQKLPEILKPGSLNEEYFTSVINDAVIKLNESKEEVGLPRIFNPRLLLVIYENNVKKYTVGPIKSIERLGQELEKTDVRIKTDNGNINISLKKENFSFWSSADTYENVPMQILNKTLQSGKVALKTSPGQPSTFVGNVGGIRVPATIPEVKKYCFGGPTGVDYIVINAKLTGVGKNNVINMSGINIFKNDNTRDILRMLPDVYLINKDEFISYRFFIRQAIINPSLTIQFPQEPKAIWSSTK
jgi:hypothetical protein